MAFGLGFLFDPLKNLGRGTALLGPPNLPTGPGGAPSLLKATEPIGTGAAPDSPFKLLKAGGEDIVPPPLVGGPAANLATDRGVVISGGGGSDTLAGGTGKAYDAPPQSAGAAARSDGPPLATPVQASAANPPPDIAIRAPYQAPGAGGGAGAGIAVPPPPGVVAPAAAGGPATTGSTGTGGAAAGPVPTTQLGQQSALSKLADMGKALGAAGGGAASGISGHAPGGIGGDPAAASRSGSSQLLQAVMEANKPAHAGPPPGLPNVFSQRFKR